MNITANKVQKDAAFYTSFYTKLHEIFNEHYLPNNHLGPNNLDNKLINVKILIRACRWDSFEIY